MSRPDCVTSQRNSPLVFKLMRLLLPLGLALLFLGPLLFLGGAPLKAANFGGIKKLVSKSSVTTGEEFMYTIVITNLTGANVRATITDVVPAGIVPQQVLDSGTLSNGKITWQANVDNLQSAQVRFTAIATKTGTINNSDYGVSSGEFISHGDPTPITVTPGAADHLSVEVSPASLSVGPSSSANLLITVADAYGNPVANETTVSIDFTLGAIDGKSPGTTVTATTVGGQVSKTFYAMTQAGTAQLTVAAAGLSPVITSVDLQPGPPATMVITATPTTISVIGGEQSTITAAVQDQYGNPIDGQPITFTTDLDQLNGSGSSVVVTSSGGQASVTLAGTTAGTATVSAQSGSLLPQTSQVYVAPGPPTQIRFNPASNVPVSIEANGQSSVDLQLLVLDMHGNRVTQPTDVSISTSLGTLTGGDSTYAETTTNGLVQFSLTSITQTGTANLEATVLTLRTDRSVNFLPGAPASIDLTIDPPAIVADGHSDANLVATAYDQFHNIVEDVPITFTFSVGRGMLNGDPTETTTSGAVLRTLTSDITLGSVPITVAVEGLITPALATVDFVVGPPFAVDVVAGTTSITVGHSVPLTLTVYDQVGHLIPAVPITVSTPIGSVSPAVDNTDGSGQTYRTLFSTAAGSATLTTKSYNGVVAISGTKTIVFKPDAPALATLQADPTQIVADGLTTAVITATVTDIFANPVSGVTPAFTTTLGTLEGSGATNASGVTTRILRSSTTLGTATVDVVSLIADLATVDFVTGPPDAAVLRATPATAFVLGLGSPDLVTLAITVTDRVGHPLANQSLPVSASFGTLSDCTNTNSQGVLTCNMQSTKSGNPTITVGSIVATGDVITFKPGTTATSIQITPQGTSSNPVHVTSGQSFQFTAVAKDVYHNTIPGALFSWSTRPNPPNDGTGTINTGGIVVGQKAGRMIVGVSSNMGGYAESHIVVDPGPAVKGQLTVNPTTLPIGSFADVSLKVTDSYGNAINYTYCPTLNSTIGIPTLNCTNPSSGIALGSLTSITQTGVANLTVPGLSPVTGNSSVTFTPGPPVKVKVTAGTTTLHANGYASTPLTVLLQDNYDNPVIAGYTVHSIETTLGALSCNGFSTDANGTISCTLTAGTVEGTASFTVRYMADQPLIDNGSDTVDFIIGIPKTMIIDPAGPLTVTAGLSTAFKVDVYDEGNALVPTDRLNYSWFSESQGGLGTFSPLPADSWQTSFVGQRQGNVKVRVSVWDNDLNYVSPGTTYLYIQPAPPVEGTLAVNPDSVPADGVSPVTLSLTGMRDSYSNVPRNGDTVTFMINTRPDPITITGSIVDNSVSVAVPAPTVAGTYQITVTNSNNQEMIIGGETAVTFTAGEPARAEIYTATPPQLVADGVSTSAVVLQVTDRFSNPVTAGWPLNFTTTVGTFPAGGTTDSNGRVNGTLQAGLVLGSARITVTHASTQFLAGGSIPLIAGPAQTAAIVAGTTSLSAGGGSAELVFTAQDAWGHPVDGQIITPTISPALGWFLGSRTVVSGQVVLQLVPFTQTGSATVSVEGLTVSGDTGFTVGPNVAALARVAASPASLTVGQSSALDIAITDAYGNPVPPTAITVTSTLSGTFDGNPSPVVKTTVGSSGHISTVLRSTTAGLEPLAFNGPAGPLSLHPDSQAVEYRPDTLIIVTLDATGPITWMAGQPLPITASSRDIYGNIIDPWEPVDYIWNQSAGVDAPGYGSITGVDAHNRTVEFMPQKTGQNHLRAINAPFQSEPLTITVMAAPPTEGLIPVPPPSVPADNVSTTTIRLTNLTDGFGNAVEDGHTITVTVDTRTATGVVSGGEANVVLAATKKAGTHTIHAESAAGPMNLTEFTGVTFTPGPPAKAVITASRKIVPVDETATLNITLYDQYNNRVADGTLATVSVGKANVGGNSSPTVGGKTSRTVSPYALGDGLISVSGPNGSLFLQGDTKLTFIPGTPVYAAITASPQPRVVGDGSSTATLDVSIKDGLHFPIVGSGTAVITVSRGSILPTSTLVTNGLFETTFTADRSVGPVDIALSYNGAPLLVEGDSLELIAGAPYSATLAASPPEIHVDSAEQSTVQLALFDAWHNALPSGTVVTVTSSLGTVSPGVTTTAGNGISVTLTPGAVAGPVVFTVTATGNPQPLILAGDALTILPGGVHRIEVLPTTPVWVTAGSSTTFSAVGYDRYDNPATTGPFNWRKVYGSGDGVLANGVFKGTLAGTLGIQAYTGTVYSPEKPVTILPGALFTSVVHANPITVPVGGVPSQLTITARDAYGNLVANGTSAQVTTDLGTLTGSGTTQNGILTRTLLSSDFSGRAHIYVNGKAAAGDSIFFAPRAWMTAIPGTMVADGTSQAEIRIRMLDGNGQPTGQIPATVTATLGLLNYDDCAAESGVFVCTLTAANQVGPATIYVDGLPAQGVITFTTGAPALATVSADPGYVTVHGLNTSTLALSVQDMYGHTITDFADPLTVTTSLGALSGVEPTVGGVTHRVLTGGDTAGTATISVQGFSVGGDRQIPVVGVVANVSASASYLTADGQNSASLTITLENALGQPLTDVNAPITVTTSLGALSRVEPTVNGVTHRTLTAGTQPGLAEISVANASALTGTHRLDIFKPVIHVVATPSILMANTSSPATLKFYVNDIYGNLLSKSTLPLTVSTSLGNLSGFQPTVGGVTQRTLTPGGASSMAQLAVAGQTLVGDTKIQFVGSSLVDGGFESGLSDWYFGSDFTPTPVTTRTYTGTALGSDVVGTLLITPRRGGTMARLGATTSGNEPHAVGDTWLRQSVYVSPTGVTQVTYWYRLLSYDVSIGSAYWGYQEWDPLKVYLNGQEKWEDSDAHPERVYSSAWQAWHDGPPSPPPAPLDTGWQQGVLDLTPYAGQIVSLEFRLFNNNEPVDNTWVYLDDITVLHQETQTYKVFVPIVMK